MCGWRDSLREKRKEWKVGSRQCMIFGRLVGRDRVMLDFLWDGRLCEGWTYSETIGCVPSGMHRQRFGFRLWVFPMLSHRARIKAGETTIVPIQEVRWDGLIPKAVLLQHEQGG